MEGDTDLADRGSLRSQRLVPLRAEPTDDCSLLTPLLFQPRDFLVLERVPTLRVVPKPIETRTRRRQEHDSTVTCGAITTLDGLAHRRRIDHGHHPIECLVNKGRGFPDGNDRLAKRRHRPTKLRKVAALEATANDGDDAAWKTLDGATGCLDVGSLGIVDEANTTDLTGRLHHVGEAMEPSQGRGHCLRRTIGQRCHRGRSQHVVQHVATGEFHG